jgi:hypothetical protein
MVTKTQSKPARKHHYIPQFYLSGFTDSGEKSGLLHAHDLQEETTWQAKPANVAFKKDFYKIDAPGINVDHVEKAFAEFEGEAARVLRKITELNKLPGRPKDYGILMYFMAQLVVRRPSVRETAQRQKDDLIRMVLHQHAAMPDDQLRARLEFIRSKDPDLPEVELETFRDFIKSDEYSIEFSQNYHMTHLLKALLPTAEALVPVLAARHWVFWLAQESANFITNDRPVNLSWTVDVGPFYANSPGFGLTNTAIVFPLSKRLVMYGRFDGPRGAVLPANNQRVALINRVTARSAIRFVYSTDKDFALQKEGGEVGGRNDMFDEIRIFKSKNAAQSVEIDNLQDG